MICSRVCAGGLFQEFLEDGMDHFLRFLLGQAGMAMITSGDEFASAGVPGGDFEFDEVGVKIPGPTGIIGNKDFDIVGHHREWSVGGHESSTAEFSRDERIGGMVVVEAVFDIEVLELIEVRCGVASGFGR